MPKALRKTLRQNWLLLSLVLIPVAVVSAGYLMHQAPNPASSGFWYLVGIGALPLLVWVYFALLPLLAKSPQRTHVKLGSHDVTLFRLRWVYFWARAGLLIEVVGLSADLLATTYIDFHSGTYTSIASWLLYSHTGGQNFLQHTPDYLALVIVFWTTYLATESEFFAGITTASLASLHEVPWGPFGQFFYYQQWSSIYKEDFTSVVANINYTVLLVFVLYLWFKRYRFWGQKTIALITLGVVVAWDVAWALAGFPITQVGSTLTPLYHLWYANAWEIGGWLIPVAIFEVGMLICWWHGSLKPLHEPLWEGLELKWLQPEMQEVRSETKRLG